MANGELAKEITLKTGESGMVHVSYEVRRSGNIQEMVTLKTNDPYRSIVYLTLRGTVPQDLQVTPPSLSFAGDNGMVLQRVVNVIGPPSMDVKETSTDNPALKVKLKPEAGDDAEKSWKVAVTLGDNAPVGDWKATVTIKTTHPDRPTITIPVDVHIRGDLELTPKSAFFGFLKVGAKATQTIRVTSRTGSAFKVTKVISPDPKIVNVTIDEPQKEGIHNFTLTVNTNEKRFIDTSITLHTDVPGEETLTVPVTALVE